MDRVEEFRVQPWVEAGQHGRARRDRRRKLSAGVAAANLVENPGGARKL
jgi:hypothetical protein